MQRHGADDGQAGKDAHDGPEDHGQVAQRVLWRVGAVPEEVGDGGGQMVEGRGGEEGVEVLVDVEVPAGRPAARLVVLYHRCKVRGCIQESML